MASLAMLLDLTLSDLEGQNQDWTSFSTQFSTKSGLALANVHG